MTGKSLMIALGLVAAVTVGCEKKQEAPAAPSTSDASKQVDKAAADAKDKTDDMKEEAKKAVDEGKEKADDMADDAKKAIDNMDAKE